MKTQISIDLETLGTHIDSQILSIGACVFDLKTGNIGAQFYSVIVLAQAGLKGHMNVTAGTLEFWLAQPAAARDAIWGKEAIPHKQYEPAAFASLSNWINEQGEVEMWANGTKFDLGMLEEGYRMMLMPVPWEHNADRCMRTLRKFAGHIDTDYVGIAHHALHDAIWQAKYISAACNKLGLV